MSIVTRLRLKERAKPSAVQERSSSSHRMQIVMSEASAQKLTDLRDMLEASSYGEVVRRALQYYEKLLKHFELSSVLRDDESDDEKALTARVQIVLPSRTLDRLEALKSASPLVSYGEIIRTALTVYRRACFAHMHGKPFVIHRENGEPITVHSTEIAA